MEQYKTIIGLIILVLVSLPVSNAFSSVDNTGDWRLEVNEQHITIGDYFFINYKVPKTVYNNQSNYIYGSFANYDYSTTISDQYITAYKANIQHSNEILNKICVVVKQNRGSPELVPTVNQIVYSNDSKIISNTNYEEICWDLNVNLSIGNNYFGVKCLNCNNNNRFRIQVEDVDDSYYYYDGGWIDSEESYNLFGYSVVNNEVILSDSYLQLLNENHSFIINLNNFSSINSYDDLLKFRINSTGKYYVVLKNSVGSILSEVPGWVIYPSEQQLISSLALEAKGVFEANINDSVVQTWSFFNPYNAQITSVNCSVYELMDDFSKLKVDVNPYLEAININPSGNGVLRVNWFANSSVINQGTNYETSCVVNIVSGGVSYELPAFSQFVSITREKGMFDLLINIFNKLIGINNFVNESFVLQNDTYNLLVDVNRSMNNMVVNTDFYNDTLAFNLFKPVSVVGDAAFLNGILVKGGEYYVGANCSYNVFSQGVIVNSGLLVDKGNGFYSNNLTGLESGNDVLIKCVLSNGENAFDEVRLNNFDYVNMEMLS